MCRVRGRSGSSRAKGLVISKAAGGRVLHYMFKVGVSQLDPGPLVLEGASRKMRAAAGGATEAHPRTAPSWRADLDAAAPGPH